MATARSDNIDSGLDPRAPPTLLEFASFSRFRIRSSADTSEPSLLEVPRISAHIIAELPRNRVLCLTLISSGFYRLLQPLLYSHITVCSFEALYKLAWTIQNPVDIEALGGSIPKDVKRLAADFGDGEDGPKAVSLSAVLQRIASHCPDIGISLRVKDKFCYEQPMISFSDELFPRVDLLYVIPAIRQSFSCEYAANCVENIFAPLDLATTASWSGPRPGVPASSFEVIPRRRSEVQDPEHGVLCRPAVQFWRGMLGGHSLPDVTFLRIDHEPVSEADARHRGPQLQASIRIRPSDVRGVRRLRWLDINNCPEFNDSVLAATLPWMAVNLTVLRINTNPALTYRGIARLLHRVLPNLNFFQLSIDSWNDSAERSYESFVDPGERLHSHPHLCPLLRRFCRNAKHVLIDIPYICRDILLDERRSRVIDMAIRGRRDDPNPATREVADDIVWRYNKLAPTGWKRWHDAKGDGYVRAYITRYMCQPEDHKIWAIFVVVSYRNFMWIFGLQEMHSCITVSPQNNMMRHPWTAVHGLIRDYIHRADIV